MSQIFARKEVTSDNLMQIVSTLTSNDNAKFASEFMQALAKTSKFDLVLKLLTKGEKKSKAFIFRNQSLV